MKSIRLNSVKIVLLALCAAMAMGAQAVAAGSPFPVYPGATQRPTQMKGTQSFCGSKMGIVSYHTAADGKSVAKWYESKIPGAGVLDGSTSDSSSVNTEFEILAPDASELAIIHQISMSNPKLQAAAKSLDADKTDIGFETFDPPLGADFVSLVKRAKNGDAAAKTALAAKCPQ